MKSIISVIGLLVLVCGAASSNRLTSTSDINLAVPDNSTHPNNATNHTTTPNMFLDFGAGFISGFIN